LDGYKSPLVVSLWKSTALRHGKRRQIELAPGNIYSDAMARKAKRRTRKSNRNKTDWAIGQPLVFPPKRNSISRLARETVAEVINGPFKLNRQNPKKKAK
jgi:hypothetical protein